VRRVVAAPSRDCVRLSGIRRGRRSIGCGILERQLSSPRVEVGETVRDWGKRGADIRGELRDDGVQSG